MPAIKRIDPADRAKVLYVRVSEQEHSAVKAAAERAGMKVGDYCREKVVR